ncbi:Fur family transcriptional regulator [Enemella evansiae]|uniref:Fur family transcriptional regulator n=1 Tax=Enemella evansiae TaxID=2016499 RepID=UPI000B97596A|nr:transcriptional repressor [Enemella evansiae]OYN93812.1 transcriptional repressor [Enemella evansiae]OYO05887.1 transcriptional repressor [Enemella evansiae]
MTTHQEQSGREQSGREQPGQDQSGAPAQPGQRRTRQRAAIAALLAEVDDFRTAQQTHDLLRAAGQSVGLTTVYRTLQAMADAGELDAIRVNGEQAYRRCGSSEHHHHLVCRQCGRAVEISGPTVEKWATRVAAEHGFREVGHELELFGVCSSCATTD